MPVLLRGSLLCSTRELSARLRSLSLSMDGVSPESSCTTKHTKSTKRESPFSLAAVFSGLFFLGLHHNLWVNWQGIDEQLAAFG